MQGWVASLHDWAISFYRLGWRSAPNAQALEQPPNDYMQVTTPEKIPEQPLKET